MEKAKLDRKKTLSLALPIVISVCLVAMLFLYKPIFQLGGFAVGYPLFFIVFIGGAVGLFASVRWALKQIH